MVLEKSLLDSLCRIGCLMLPKPVRAVPSHDVVSKPIRTRTREASGLLGWSSFFFALLQSVCTFFIAVSGLRLLIGITSLTVTAGFAAALDRFHANWIRIPMIALALAGTVLNLVVLAQVRYLRSRPASQWRIKPPSLHTLRMERIQFVLSIATLILIGLEEYFHIHHSHTL